MNAIGIDIGTTTICAIVVDTQTGAVIRTVTEKNDTQLAGKPFEQLQDPGRILQKATHLIDELIAEYPPVACIGITGQMHGMLYLNRQGEALSPLYTWQDESANQPFRDGRTYAQVLSEETGYPMAAGFGISTLYVHAHTEQIPVEASCICTIHDYIAMKLAGRQQPVMHPSDAASYGCYDTAVQSFDAEALSRAGLDASLLPAIGSDSTVLGLYQRKIPVSLAIGDNQASYIGAVCNMHDCLLVNIGTGSQISLSVPAEYNRIAPDMELRPCTDGRMIAVGSSLCGGRAFATLERFFRQVTEMVTGFPCSSAYPGMDRILDSLSSQSTTLSASTQFCGTRRNPDERGRIDQISLDNFTPQDFMLGVLQGIADELYTMYAGNGESLRSSCLNLIGSGNGLRQNPTLQKIIEATFGMPLRIPQHKEEAAFGAVLFALAATKLFPSIETAQALICYQK